MTNIHIWAPRRYKFEGFQETLEQHPFFQNGRLRSVRIHYRHQLTHDHLYDIFTLNLLERGNKTLNIFAFDDDEIEDGCGLDMLEMSIKHFINITKVHTRTYFLFADLIDYLYSDATYSRRDLTRLKQAIVENVNQAPTRNFYKDFQGCIDGADCDCYNAPNEEGMKKLFETFSIILSVRSPPGLF